MKKVKVVWIAYFSNEIIRKHLEFNTSSLLYKYRKLRKRKEQDKDDVAVWNTNAIIEFEKYKDIELHVIVPFHNLKGKLQQFKYNNIYYYFFNSYDDGIIYSIKKRLFKETSIKNTNSKYAKTLIDKINPDIIHLIGAENPFYSSIILDLDINRPIIVSLQTLMNDKEFIHNYPISKESYAYRSNIEKLVIQKADYIGTIVPKYQEIIKKDIKPNAKILNITLALGENIEEETTIKKYDFVYFASNINKACDLAIKAFALAHQSNPKITLNIVGGYDLEYKIYVDNLINELGIKDFVFFTGRLTTHNDVINQIKQSRFALLPLKIDIISGTIREAMACHLPVVSTITPGTPDLNRKRESILLSEVNDFVSMANNMNKLIYNNDYANEIRRNAIETLKEQYNNETAMLQWRNAYYAIKQHCKYNTLISKSLLI